MKLKEVEREIKMRRMVYPGSVRRGSMSSQEADRLIQVMEAIADDYRRKITPDLFATTADSPSASAGR